MTKLERDHFALKAREERGERPYVEQFQCGMCGAWFLMRTSLTRHKEAELPGFIEQTAAKRAHYEASRVLHRIIHPVIDKETLKRLEAEEARRLRLVR